MDININTNFDMDGEQENGLIHLMEDQEGVLQDGTLDELLDDASLADSLVYTKRRLRCIDQDSVGSHIPNHIDQGQDENDLNDNDEYEDDDDEYEMVMTMYEAHNQYEHKHNNTKRQRRGQQYQHQYEPYRHRHHHHQRQWDDEKDVQGCPRDTTIPTNISFLKQQRPQQQQQQHIPNE